MHESQCKIDINVIKTPQDTTIATLTCMGVNVAIVEIFSTIDKTNELISLIKNYLEGK
jgi:uncharacterized membrane protein